MQKVTLIKIKIDVADSDQFHIEKVNNNLFLKISIGKNEILIGLEDDDFMKMKRTILITEVRND